MAVVDSWWPRVCELDHAGTNLILAWCKLDGPPGRCNSIRLRHRPDTRPHPSRTRGKVDLMFAVDGVNCRIEIPIRQPSPHDREHELVS